MTMPGADEPGKEQAYAGDHKPVFGARDATDRQRTALPKLQE